MQEGEEEALMKLNFNSLYTCYQRDSHTDLSCHCVRSRWKELCDTSRLESILDQSERSSQSCTAGSHDNSIIRVVHH